MTRSTRVRSPSQGLAVVTPKRPPASVGAHHPLIRLQTHAGNRAVAALVQPKRTTAGWTGADTSGPGWNVGAKANVENSGVRRIPVDDLAVGNQAAFTNRTETERGKKVSGEANERADTRESAAGRAIVLKPELLDVNAPIDVLLHLHGYTSRSWDPYAGWRQSRRATTKGTDKNYHAVRDVDQDRIAQQIGATKNPQILGVLPQGVGHSEFNNLVPRQYVDAVITRLEEINELKKPVSGTRQLNIVLSAHSGGGHTVRTALNAELAAAKAKGKAAAVAPAAPVEVVLFEAINNASELRTVKEWVDHHLGRVRGLLDAATTPADRDTAIASCPILRAYRSRDVYVARYDALAKHIDDWFADPKNAGVVGADAARLRARFRVEVLAGITGGAGHEKVVGGLGKPEEGPLADALSARRDPTASNLLRGGKLMPPATGAPTKASSNTPKSSATGTAAPAITFGKRARRDVVALSTLATLGDVLRTAGLTKATITSTARTPVDQARAMYQNLAGSDSDAKVASQYRLYGAGGDKVIDTFVALRDAGKSAAEIQEGMRDRILEIGPRTVSKHLAEPETLNVIDVSPASLGGGDAVAKFEAAANDLVGSKIERLLTPGQGDPAEHLEIKPVGPAPTAGTTAGTPVAGPSDVPAPTTAPGPTTAPVDVKKPATETASASGAKGPPPGPAPSFVSDITRSTLELLPKDQRERFASIPWNNQDYPGAKYRIKDTSEANLDEWRAKPGYEVFKVAGKKGKPDTWYIRGTHQADAQALLDALAKVRPGGGERRVNTGPNAILTKAQFRKDPDAFDAYIVEQLVQPDGVKASGTRTMMNKHAAAKFVEMREAAKADGVVLSIGNAFRERARAEASAAAKDNPKAVAKYSAHSLGLAMDLNLSTKALSFTETTTEMPNTFKGLRTPAYKWMFMRGAEFGFFQFRMEPWHWEYNPPGFSATFWADNPTLAPVNEEPKRKGK